MQTGITGTPIVKFRDTRLPQQDSFNISSPDISMAMHSAEAPVCTEQHSLYITNHFDQFNIAYGRPTLGHSTPLETLSVMDYSLNPDRITQTNNIHQPAPTSYHLLTLTLNTHYFGLQQQPQQSQQQQSDTEDDEPHSSVIEIDSIDINNIDPTVPKKRIPGPRIFEKLIIRSLIRCQGCAGRARALIC